MRVGFVVDQAIDVRPEVVEGVPFWIIPGTIRLDGEDWSGRAYDEILAALEAGHGPATVGIAPPARFLRVYQEALQQVDVVFSVHTASVLTTMINSARMAARRIGAGDRIRVIDTGTATVAAGLAVEAGIARARSGADPDEIERVITETSRRCGLLFYVASLSNLIRIRPIEGLKRLLKGQVSLRSVFRVLGNQHPGGVLTLKDGKILLIHRVPDPAEALRLLLQTLQEETGGGSYQAVVGYTGDPTWAEQLKRAIEAQTRTSVPVVRMSPLILAAVGPGLFGVGFRTEGPA